ncbi:hypothetical protein ACFQU2_30910 [Siccirubricoccus deserti]
MARGFFGWQVVAAAFILAMCSWGINFYGPSVFLHALHLREGWSLSLISAAITLHFIASAVVVTRLPSLHRRFGPVAVTRGGMLCCCLGLLGWGFAAAPWMLVPAALLTAAGWAVTSGAAINAYVAPGSTAGGRRRWPWPITAPAWAGWCSPRSGPC